MHESGLARGLVELVLERAASEGASRVLRVLGRIADPEPIDPVTLELHFRAHARGTPAEGARLELAWTTVPAACRACGRQFVPESHHALVCPLCGSLDGELQGPVGVAIDAIEVETP